jgi:LysM repeat protein
MTHDGGSIDFGSYNPVDKSYQDKITLYLKQMKVEYENTVESDCSCTTKRSDDSHHRNRTEPDGNPSMAAKIFQNYYLMMARTVVQSAMDMLKEYRYSIPSGNSPSLAEIAEAFSASETQYTTSGGDTLQGIADRYGILVSTLKSANPDVSSKQPDEPLPAGTELIVLIGALTEITTNKEDTLNSIMQSYQIPIKIINDLNPCVS